MRIITTLIFLFFISSANAEQITADYVLVKKSARVLFLLKEHKIIKAYRISLGPKVKGKKLHINDGKTPEGVYTIDQHNPNSKFFYSLHISYPNEHDKKIASLLGINPGGDIYIHGLPNRFSDPGGFTGRDWTKGCLAVNNKQIREIAKMVKTGTTIEIVP